MEKEKSESIYAATKQALIDAGYKLGIKTNPEKMVFVGGKDPGGWSGRGSAVCIIHEGTGIPNEWNHPDPMNWWMEFENEVSRLAGTAIYFEWVNSCVAVGYFV